MIQTIQPHQVTLKQLKENFGLKLSQDDSFFPECNILNLSITQEEQKALDRVKSNFLSLLEDPPLLENSVKMVVISPLLDLAGFYQSPFRIETESSIEIKTEDEGLIIKGRIDVLVIKNRLWLLVIESKRSDFSVTTAIPQALAYMIANPTVDKPTFGMICNGSEFLFLKAVHSSNILYKTSQLFSLFNPKNDLCLVLELLKELGNIINA